jgi:hypothetical protein
LTFLTKENVFYYFFNKKTSGLTFLIKKNVFYFILTNKHQV